MEKIFRSGIIFQYQIFGQHVPSKNISTTKKANYSMLLGAMPNSASVNSAAMLTVNIMYPSALDIGCISHAV